MTILKKLPEVRGRLREHVPLADTSWFRVGGAAEWVFKPSDSQDLASFLKAKPPEVPVTVLGAASNTVIRDGGIEGVVIRLGRGFAGLEREGEAIIAGAANLDINVSQFALQHSLAGLEFLSGIPGAIGGALRMNAGAYGREIKDVLIQAEAVTPEGEIQTYNVEEMGFAYRHCGLPERTIFTRAWLRAEPGDTVAIAAKMDEIKTSREDSQPIRSRTGGSTFRNPPGHKAWELIDAAGLRGRVEGGAKVSEKHCNFLINTGSAKAADLERLVNIIIRQVKEHSGIELVPEIKFVGKAD